MHQKRVANGLPDPDQGWRRHLPPTGWLPTYRPRAAVRDLLTGLLVAALLLPQAMAYASLARLPPEAGLYAALAATAAYVLLGTSRYLSVGPVALVSLMVAEATANLGDTPEQRWVPALALAAMVGLTLVLLGVFRLGFLANFLSTPVLTGFTMGAALLIAISQAPTFLGIEIDAPNGFLPTVAAIVDGAGAIEPVTCLIGVAALIFLLLGRSYLRPLIDRAGLPEPWASAVGHSPPLLAILGSILAVAWLDLDGEAGVATVAAIDVRLPPFALPPTEPLLWRDLAEASLGITVVVFVTAVAVGKSLAGRRSERIDPDQEMIALGSASLGAAFTGGYPVGGSISRSALAFTARSSSPLGQLVGAALALAAAATLGPWLGLLPRTVLAAIVLSAVVGMIDLRAIARVWKFSHSEAACLAVTFLAVLLAGVQAGIACGAAAALVLYLWRTSQPRIVLERRQGTEPSDSSPGDGEQETDGSDDQSLPGDLLILRIDESLYFANTRHCEDRVLEALATNGNVRHLVLDLSTVAEIDWSAVEMLGRLTRDVRDAGIEVAVAHALSPVRERLERAGYIRDLGERRFFDSIDEAVRSCE